MKAAKVVGAIAVGAIAISIPVFRRCARVVPDIAAPALRQADEVLPAAKQLDQAEPALRNLGASGVEAADQTIKHAGDGVDAAEAARAADITADMAVEGAEVAVEVIEEATEQDGGAQPGGAQ